YSILIRYELLKFNNYFMRIAMFRRNIAYLFTKNEFLETPLRLEGENGYVNILNCSHVQLRLLLPV
ncbi:MAG: hypothetical protein LBP59_19165, partial [Planctomycetaceae bacterium]|nr:hypothetical protein [Planctomycetaceae bacterium]